MKLRTRMLSWLLCLAMIFGTLPASATAAGSPFTDVRSSDWFYEAVNYVSERGIMNGTGASTFHPGQSTTRGMIVTILHRMEGTPKAEGRAFSDVKAGSYYADAVKWASANGIVNGYSESRFGPEDPITREQLAAVLYRYMDFKETGLSAPASLSGYADAGSVSAYAKEAMAWANGAGLITGVTKTALEPRGNTTRAQTAMILMRLSRLLEDAPETPASGGTAVPNPPETPAPSVSEGGIYSKELDPDHVKTGTLTFEGESYEGEFIDNELVVVAAESAKRSDIVKLASARGGKIVGEIPSVGYYQLELDKAYSGAELEKLAGELMKEKAVEDAYVNTVTEYESDAFYPDDYQRLYSTDSNLSRNEKKRLFWAAPDSPYVAPLLACHVPEAWELVKSVNSNPSILMGVIDASMDASHTDLKFTGAYTHYDGYNPYAVGTTKPYDEDVEHGTHIAGIMGARQNSKGVAGVALNASLIGVATRSMGGLMASEFRRAQDTALLIEDGVRVINMSLGNDLKGKDGKKDKELTKNKKNKVKKSAEKTYDELAKYVHMSKDFLIVTSSGNDGEVDSHDTNYNNMFCNIKDSLLYDRIIVVGNATLFNDNGELCISREKSSSYKGGRVDVMAPGTAIYSLRPGSRECGYETGTSMAAPFVAGLAGLVWEANPDLPPEKVKQIICASAVIDVADSEKRMVDAEAAVLKAIGGDYDRRENNVTFVFVDKATNAGLAVNKMDVQLDSYEGSGGDRDWVGKMIYQDEVLNDSTLTLPLNYGTYTLTFSAKGYQNATEEKILVDADADKLPIHIFMDPTGAVQKQCALHVRLTDKDTGEKLKLKDVFGEGTLGMTYNDAFVGLVDGESEAVVGGHLYEANDDKTDGMYLEDDEIVFSGLEPGTYSVVFGAESAVYDIPEAPQTVKVEQDLVHKIPLAKKGGPATAGDEYPLVVGDIQVTDANAADILGDGTASYVAQENALYLDGAQISAQRPVSYSGDDLLMIYIDGDVRLAGTQAHGDVIYSKSGVSVNGGPNTFTGTLTIGAGSTVGTASSTVGRGIYSPGLVELHHLSFVELGSTDYGIASDTDIQVSGCRILYDTIHKSVFYGGTSASIDLSVSEIGNNNVSATLVETGGEVYLKGEIHVAVDGIPAIIAGRLKIGNDSLRITAFSDTQVNLIEATEGIELTNLTGPIAIHQPDGGEISFDSVRNVYTIRNADSSYPSVIDIH